MQIRSAIGTKSTSSVLSGDGTTATTLFAAVDNLVERSVTQLDTVAFYIKRGGGCSATNFDFIMPACSATRSGSVSTLVFENYYGIVTALATTASTFTCNVATLTAF